MSVQPRNGQQRQGRIPQDDDIGAMVPAAPRKRPRRGDRVELESFAGLAALENWTFVPQADADPAFLESQTSDVQMALGAAGNRVEDREGEAGSEDMVIFRVPHKHPHMLKRPLQHVDAMSALDLAVRVYSVVRSDGADGFLVQRAPGADIFLTELLTSVDAGDSHLTKKLKQYKVQDQIELDTGNLGNSLVHAWHRKPLTDSRQRDGCICEAKSSLSSRKPLWSVCVNRSFAQGAEGRAPAGSCPDFHGHAGSCWRTLLRAISWPHSRRNCSFARAGPYRLGAEM